MQVNIFYLYIVICLNSTIVLSFPPHHIKTYVANRMSTCEALTATWQWKNVSSGDNPEDVIYRGTDSATMANNFLWWKEIAFLKFDDELPYSEHKIVADENYLCKHKGSNDLNLYSTASCEFFTILFIVLIMFNYDLNRYVEFHP